MPNHPISSLRSPHVERVKALLSSRGKKVRRERGEFVVDNLPAIFSAIKNRNPNFPSIKTLYYSESGLEKLTHAVGEIPAGLESYLVTSEVLAQMADVESPQGVLAVAAQSKFDLAQIFKSSKKIAYFWQLQDPGNAGTVIRSADGCGFDAVLFSDESVDIYGPKVVRATVGSLWNIPVLEEISLSTLITFATEYGYAIVALDAKSEIDIANVDKANKTILVFGNEARGIPDLPNSVSLAAIPMRGKTESFNVASAATIAMYEVGLR